MEKNIKLEEQNTCEVKKEQNKNYDHIAKYSILCAINNIGVCEKNAKGYSNYNYATIDKIHSVIKQSLLNTSKELACYMNKKAVISSNVSSTQALNNSITIFIEASCIIFDNNGYGEHTLNNRYEFFLPISAGMTVSKGKSLEKEIAGHITYFKRQALMSFWNLSDANDSEENQPSENQSSAYAEVF